MESLRRARDADAVAQLLLRHVRMLLHHTPQALAVLSRDLGLDATEAMARGYVACAAALLQQLFHHGLRKVEALCRLQVCGSPRSYAAHCYVAMIQSRKSNDKIPMSL